MSALKSKTILFGLLLAVFGVIEANLGVLQPFLSEKTFGLFSMSVGVIVMVLRAVTTTPLSEK